MNRYLRPIVLFAMCASLLLTLSACSKRHGPPAMPPTAVHMATAFSTNAPIVIKAFGNTKEIEGVNVIPQVSGMLVKTFIEDGAVVAKGQPLFLIDPRDYSLRVRQTEGQVAADRANLELNRQTLERNRPLLAKSMVSQETFDTLKTKVDSTAAQLQIDEALLEQARLDLSRCTVTSAVDGVCSKRFLDNGNLVTANQTKLTNIRCYNPLFLDFSVPEQDLTLLRQALTEGSVRIELTPRGDTNIYTGTLVFLDNAVDIQTGTVALRGKMPNADRKLWSQQFVEVRIFAGIASNAVMVPESSVQFGKHGPYTFVASKENTAELRLVKLGLRYNGLLQIVEGVAAGERVVALGQLMLYPGAAVAEAQQ